MRRTPRPAPGSRGRRRTATLAATTALLVGTTAGGCVAGSSTTTSTLGAATAVPTSKATATLPTEGASLAGQAPDPDAQPVPTGEGVPGTDFAETMRGTIAAKGSVRMMMATAAGSAAAQVDTRSKAMKVSVETQGRTVTLVHLGGRTWVKGAGTVEVQLPSATPGGKPRTDVRHWLLLDPGGADRISQRLGAQAKAADTLDPARFTRMLDGLLGDKTPRGEGSQVVFSVPPTQYLDAVAAPAALRSQVSKAVRLVVVQDKDGVPTSVTVTVPTRKGELTDRTEYSRWGQPVEVKEPSPDDVAPAPGSPAAAATAPTEAPAPSASKAAPTARSAPATSSARRSATPTRSGAAPEPAGTTTGR